MSISTRKMIFIMIVPLMLFLFSAYAFGLLFPDKVITIEDNSTLTNGFNYSGQMKGGKFEGKGTINFSNGDIYTGHFKSGMPDGIGIMKTALGDEYKCEFRDGVLIDGR